ncbi:hypothetical protein ACJX0J_025237 [Zea mays]
MEQQEHVLIFMEHMFISMVMKSSVSLNEQKKLHVDITKSIEYGMILGLTVYMFSIGLPCYVQYFSWNHYNNSLLLIMILLMNMMRDLKMDHNKTSNVDNYALSMH